MYKMKPSRYHLHAFKRRSRLHFTLQPHIKPMAPIAGMLCCMLLPGSSSYQCRTPLPVAHPALRGTLPPLTSLSPALVPSLLSLVCALFFFSNQVRYSLFMPGLTHKDTLGQR